MFKLIFAIALGLCSIMGLVLLSFAYRDFSVELFGMFTLILLGLPSSTYILIKNSVITPPMDEYKKCDENFEVVGKFSLFRND